MSELPDKILTLYSGKQCHLCDIAEALIRQTLPSADDDMKKVDVSNNHQLYHLYGAKIPVLKRWDTLEEITWPFNQQQLIEFLS